MKRLLFTVYLFAFSIAIFAQNKNEFDILKHRLNQINKYHIGVGGEFSAKTNIVYGIKTFVGYGHFHHLLNVDIGFGIRSWNYPMNNKNRYKMFQVPIFVSFCFNPIRWSNGCFFIGEETSLQLGIWNSAINKVENYEFNDRNALKNYVSIKGKIGINIKHINIAFTYEQDLSSFCNQQYIYESGVFDFEKLHNSIYEHNRLGLSLSYIINL